MKKFLRSLAIAIYTLGTVCLFNACSKEYLERTPSDFISVEEVFTNLENAEAFLNNAYGALPDFQRQSVDKISDYMLGGGTDEIGFQQSSFVVGTPYDFNNGNWNAVVFPLQHLWFDYYAAIRRINVFLANYDKIPNEVSSSASGRKERLLGEAYGLRGFYYFELFKMWGGVPLIDKPLEPELRESVHLSRSTPEETVAFIQADLNQAIQLLPAKHDDSQYGRFSATIARALLSRLSLFFASELWNPTADPGRWSAAATASKEALEYAESNGYALSLTASGGRRAYERIFLELNNPEVIWSKSSGDITSYGWDYYNSPIGYGGWYVNSPLQEMVDAYEMENGELPVLGYSPTGEQIVNPNAGYDPQNPFVNRDPRFYQSILYHGAMWQGRAVNIAPGGADNVTIGAIQRVNYFARKYLLESHNLFTDAGNTYRRFAIIRLAELYLNYAEALNESEGPTAAVYQAINTIRNRSDMPDLPIGLSKDEMRARIRHERRIELAFEDHRFWDVRRWKIAATVDNGPVHKLVVDANGTFTYPVHQTRIFDERKHYLFPIPQSELDKNPNMVQNPGW
jgi:SusD family.